MVLIDKTKATVRLVLTLKESTEAGVTSYTLVMRSLGTGKDFQFTLPSSTSLYPDRYDDFVMSIADFSDLPAGQYSFDVKTNNGNIVEKGVALVITAPQGYTYIEPATTDDDFIVFEN